MKKSTLLRFRDDFEQAYKSDWRDKAFYGTLNQAKELIDADILEPWNNQLDCFRVPNEEAWQKLCELYSDSVEKLETEKLFHEKQTAWVEVKLQELKTQLIEQGLLQHINGFGFTSDSFWVNISRLSSSNAYLHVLYPDSTTYLSVYLNLDIEKRFEEIRMVDRLNKIITRFQEEYNTWMDANENK